MAHHLVEMVAASVKEELFSTSLNPLTEEAYKYGVMPHDDRLAQVKLTLEEVVCPGLAHFGIDVSNVKNWLHNRF